MLRGEVSPRVAALEAARRVRVANDRRRERAELAALDQQPALLREEFARIRASDLLAHFRARVKPKFLPGFHELARTAELQQALFPQQTEQLLKSARRIVDDHCWPLLGFGEKCFGKNEIQWNADPLSGVASRSITTWTSISSQRSDARVTGGIGWRISSRSVAYAITNDERFSKELFRQLKTGHAESLPAVLTGIAR
jgi:hypothetical protein